MFDGAARRVRSATDWIRHGGALKLVASCCLFHLFDLSRWRSATGKIRQLTRYAQLVPLEHDHQLEPNDCRERSSGPPQPVGGSPAQNSAHVLERVVGGSELVRMNAHAIMCTYLHGSQPEVLELPVGSGLS